MAMKATQEIYLGGASIVAGCAVAQEMFEITPDARLIFMYNALIVLLGGGMAAIVDGTDKGIQKNEVLDIIESSQTTTTCTQQPDTLWSGSTDRFSSDPVI